MNISTLFSNNMFQLLNTKNSIRDTLLKNKANTVLGNTNTVSLNLTNVSDNYNNILKNSTSYISSTILNIINFDCESVRKHGNIFSVNGVEFESSQIPAVSSSQCKETSVTNNTITFDSNSYYKFVGENEGEHKLVCKNNSLGALFSESMSGTGVDAESSKYAKFWNCAGSEDPTFIGLNFSKSEIESYFSQAGIEPGFYTVKMGEEENTNYYSEGKNSPGIIPKNVYDETYNAITTGKAYCFYEPGSVFKIGEESYILNDDYTLDIPYGADIYNMTCPPIS